MKKELLFQGAEAKIYKWKWINKNAIVKHRISKCWRHPDIDIQLTKMRTKTEVRALTRCRMAGIRTPCVYAVNLEKCTIVMENIEDSITVKNYLYDLSKQVSNNILSESEFDEKLSHLAKKLGEDLFNMHKDNILHGDLTTSNMLLTLPYEDSPITFIDFGLSSFSEKVEDKAVDLYVLQKAILCTHPRTEHFVEHIFDAYGRIGGKLAKNILDKLSVVNSRGKKRLCHDE